MNFLFVLWRGRSCVKGRMGTLEDGFPLSGAHPVNCVTAAYQRFRTLPPPRYFHKRVSGIITVELRGHLSKKTSTAQNICVHTNRTEVMSLPHKNSFIVQRMKPAKHWPQRIRKFPKIFSCTFGFWWNESFVWIIVTFYLMFVVAVELCVYIWEIGSSSHCTKIYQTWSFVLACSYAFPRCTNLAW